MHEQTDQKLTVFYDGECPICTREIGFYKTCEGAGDIEWLDITQSDKAILHPGLSREDALARFHVLTPGGKLIAGGPAFAQMWTRLRKFKWLGRVLSVAPISWVLDRIYDLLLVIRPLLQKAFR
ncbi:MAG: DUF393 domain-containing protein [Rhizobiaceae bacterium]|nr:DUF393 domain-containing protein [Rhizobiaceae bacterium]